MKRMMIAGVCLAAIACSIAAYSQSASRKFDFAVMPVSYKNVKIDDAFWTPRIEKNRDVTIPGQMGRGRGSGEARVIEAACYEIGKDPNSPLRARIESGMDGLITRAKSVMGRWPTAGDGSFYGAGTFLEASVAYYDATGNRKLLDAAIEIADDLDAQFGPGKRHDISNHEGVEIGLVKLYRATGNDKYWKLAQFLIDARGNPEGRTVMYGPYAQDDVPLKTAPRAIGHAVRATYLYMPLTEVAALSDDAEYVRAADRIWRDAVGKRTYLTGGIGSYRDEEDYGDDYDLPNVAAWNEICAAYGNTLWHERMFLLHQDGQYADAMENVLYNGFLVGVSLSGDKFLYQAPLRTYAGFTRQPSFGPNCCPPNLVRLLSQLGGLIYARGDQSIYVNLFMGNTAKIDVAGSTVTLTQTTKYPWDGDVKITVNPTKAQKFAIYVRIPGWTKDAPLAGGLYRFLPLSVTFQPQLGVALAVNGTRADAAIENGYAKIEREWKAGDTVELHLPMPVRRVLADEKAAEDRGMVALQRGPLVYCAEQADNPGGVFNLVLRDDANLQFAFRSDVLGGMGEINGKAVALSRAPEAPSVAAKDVSFVAIPYYASLNRGNGDMSVWLAHENGRAVIAPAPTIASTSKATSSCGNGTVAENYPGHNPPTTARRMYPSSQDGSGSIAAICDQLEPVNSEDGSAPFLRLHPQTGDAAWVQYDFAKPEKVSSVEVYWKDDKQVCVMPQSWRLLYKDGEDWKPVNASGAYGVEKDKFNKVSFAPVTTSGLRIEIKLQPKVYKTGTLGPPDGNYMREDLTWYEGGVIEWRVKP